MLILLFFAFIAGILTTLAPCVWPLLPVIFSAQTFQSGKKRPVGIVLGTLLTFGVLTLSASYLESSFGISENVLRYISAGFLVLIGLLLIITPIAVRFESLVSSFVGRFAPKPKLNAEGSSDGFGGGLVVGISLGVLWAPCSGPILAAITSQAGQEKVTWNIVFVTIFYLLGISIPLSAFVFGGEKLIKKSRAITKRLGTIQIVSGGIIIFYAVATIFGYTAKWETDLTNNLPSFSNVLTSPENTSTVTKALNNLYKKSGKSRGSGFSPNSTTANDQGALNSKYFNIAPGQAAPDFTGIASWINSKPLTIQQLRGHVVLVDFWTYTCINCIRSLQYVTKWYNTYQKDGFVVVGVHSPEFPFEQDHGNVVAATKRFGIHYPVAQDNNLATWNAYNNEYWPAEYLIDPQGNIRRADFGEGQYDQMEHAIQLLLKNNGSKLATKVSDPLNFNYSQLISLETYLGLYRETGEQNPYQRLSLGKQKYLAPKVMQDNTFALGGNWNVANLNIVATPSATITYNFTAHQVYVILRPHQTGATDVVDVSLAGKPLVGALAGSDLVNGKIKVTSDRLYNIFNSGSTLTNDVLKLTFENQGTQAYTFTFG